MSQRDTHRTPTRTSATFTFYGIDLRRTEPRWIPLVRLYPNSGMFEYDAAALRAAHKAHHQQAGTQT